MYVYTGRDVSSATTNISLECFEHAVRLAMALANNNIIVVFEVVFRVLALTNL